MKPIACLAALITTTALAVVPFGFWKSGPTGPAFPNDDFESYTNGAQVNALNGGTHWNGAFVDRFAPTGIYEQDDFESYTDAAAVDGLNGGNLGWNGAYVYRAGLLASRPTMILNPTPTPRVSTD
jgi:hypothetical protein